MGNAEPEPGSVGYLINNFSLLNGKVWTIDPSRVNRLLKFSFAVEAVSNGDEFGSLDTTLFREGKEICNISLNSKTSSSINGVRYGTSSCPDTLVSNSGATYQAKVKASGMRPISIVLNEVYAIKK